ncbi:hypothetical protein M5G07_08135 [Serratia symbiotica]|nr:hypothetical protein [Serratia symbiotica]
MFPALCQQLVRVGEESGSLDSLLDKLAQCHETANAGTERYAGVDVRTSADACGWRDSQRAIGVN